MQQYPSQIVAQQRQNSIKNKQNININFPRTTALQNLSNYSNEGSASREYKLSLTWIIDNVFVKPTRFYYKFIISSTM